MYKKVVLVLLISSVVVQASNNWRLCDPCRCFGDKQSDCSKDKMSVTLNNIPDFLSEEIEVLNVTKHNIVTLRNDVFYDRNLTNLWKLYLDKCAIKTIEKHAFQYLEQITDISLVHNEISELDSELFSTNTNLKYLWLDNNKIKKLPNGLFNGLLNLNGLYARFNQITTVENHVFSDHPDLWIIDLSNNKLEYLNATIIDNLKYLKVLFLHENMWSCDCRLKVLHKTMLERNLYNLTENVCAYPKYLQGKEIKSLQFTDFQCWLNTTTIAKQNITIFELNNATISCTIDALPKPEFNWIFNNKNIDYKNTKYVMNSQRNDTVYHFNMTVLNLTPNDTGLYSCKINNEFNITYQKVNLTVVEIQEPLVEIFGNYSEELQLETENFILPCSITANIKPNIFWMINNTKIHQNNNFVITTNNHNNYYWTNLTIKALNYDYKGSYTCFANNKKYNSSETIFLSVASPFIPEVTISGNVFKENTNATLSCLVKSYSNVTVLWKYKNMPINKISKEGHWYNITIDNITYQDIGNYTCVANSKEGEEKDTFNIKYLYSKPKLTIHPIEFKNTSVVLSCKIFSYPLANVCIWKSDKFTKQIYVHQISETISWCNITIFNATSEDFGTYSCTAENNEGSTEKYTFLTIKQNEEKFPIMWYIVGCSIAGFVIIGILIVVIRICSRQTSSKSLGDISKITTEIKEDKEADIPLEVCPDNDFSNNYTKKQDQEDIMYIIERDLKSYDVTI